ncbi:MAG: hypothetical protein LBT80_02050 [Lactobacillaceae bacterium]|jgi:hypothetical protein|nr:hypothetical protein [Lactobacillaceae bacterium]
MTEKHPIKKAVAEVDVVAHIAQPALPTDKVIPRSESSIKDTTAEDEIVSELNSFIDSDKQ